MEFLLSFENICKGEWSMKNRELSTIQIATTKIRTKLMSFGLNT